MSAPHRRRRGFTLLEVIIAVTIVALLATLVAPNVLRFLGLAKGKKAQADVNILANQVRLYMAENGLSQPGEDFDLEVLCQAREGQKPFLDNRNQLIDPWGHAYVIVVPPTLNADFDVVCFGADGQPGGEGDNKDIVNGAR